MSKVPITFRIDGKTRSGNPEYPAHGGRSAADHASERGNVDEYRPSGQPRPKVLAVGAAGNVFSDRGLRWDNSGKNALRADPLVEPGVMQRLRRPCDKTGNPHRP
ncbi:MAG: hypothetical protein WDN69_06715 [Aliidongia sp.]